MKNSEGLFVGNSMRACFVVLERLDENLISQYCKKYDLKIDSTLSFYKNTAKKPVRCGKYEKLPKHINRRGKRKRKDSEEIAVQKKFKRKQNRVKLLCYSDEEDCPSYKNYEKNLFEAEKIKNEEKSHDSFNLKDDLTLINGVLMSGKSNKLQEMGILSKTKENPNLNSLKQEVDNTISEDVKEEKINILENMFQSSCNGETYKMLSSTLDCVSVNCNEKMDNSKKNINSECTQTKEQSLCKSEFLLNENEEIENDSREDSEDDRNTVIFESLHEDEELRDITDRKIEFKKPVKKKDMKTRKKQAVVKFRRKKLGSVKKPKNGFVEKSSNKKAVKKTAPIDNVSEDCWKEVCSLVKRLHEMYKIISQLQRESPKNGDLAVHFSTVINVQQENFHREITKSQKTILQAYGKMLISHNDPNKVVLEISRRTCLNAEDVINVLSCCFLLEGECAVEKSKNEAAEKTGALEIFQSQKAGLNSGKKLKLVNENSLRPTPRKAIQGRDTIEPSYPSLSSWTFDHHPELLQRPPNEYMPVCQPSSGVQNQIFKSFIVPFGNYPKQCEDKLCARQNCDEKTQVAADPRFTYITHDLKQKNSPFVSRHLPHVLSNHPTNIRVQSYPMRIIPQNVRFKFYPVNPSLSFCHDSAGRKMTKLSLPSRTNSLLLNYSQGKSPGNQNYQRNLETPNGNFLIPLPEAENTTERDRITHYSDSSSLPMSFSHSNIFRVAPNQIPVSGNSTGSVIYSNQKFLRQKGLSNERTSVSVDEMSRKNLRIEVNSATGLGNDSSEILQSVLDPTVPQKLTMRNYRLQAGPVLDLDTDIKRSECTEKLIPFNKERNNAEKSEDPKIENSKSRVYVCAQNGCKNPGVRVCGGCESIIYCSSTCQLKNWTQKHKEECHQLKKLRE